ncbi:MAG: AAA family ATPase [Desulfuromusa sp.]|jgi:general secretion pathway protein A|nr:AAA family ATPase [Desulfuromusa sp.]
MYAEYFGLNEKPFSIAPDPNYLYMSDSHQEALAHLLFGLQTEGGFVLLTGEVGTGKTTLCKCMFEQAPPEINFAFIINPKITALELLETVCDELSIERPEQASKKNMIDRINKHLLKINEQGKKTVIVIDEAQNLTADVLEQLRLLTNLETSRHKLLQIVLLGQPELRELIRRPQLSQLSQRITARYHLGPLSEEDTALYILHRINIAGGERVLFTDGANKLIYKLTGGIPRLINLLCDRSLLGAYTELEEEVTRGIVKQAGIETFDLELKNHQSKWLLAALSLSAIAAIVFALTIFPESGINLPAVQSAVAPDVNPVSIAQPVEPAQSSLSVEEKKPDLEPLPALWPDKLGFGNSFDSVFSQLAVLWMLDYSVGASEPCVFAKDHGLRCLKKKGSFEWLKKLNRPVILTLYDDQGLPFYTLLSRLNGHSAVFLGAEKPIELDIDVLENRWFGEYFLLWKAPASFPGLLFPGQQSGMTGWLAAALERHGLYQVKGTEKVLEGSLLGALKQFQFMSNLTPDGVLGVQTIIQLNRGIDTPGPRLFEGDTD